LLYLIRKNSGEVLGVGVDPVPTERLGTRIGPILGLGGNCDFVRQRRRGEGKEKGGKAEHSCKGLKRRGVNK
jgi:hypothetical protein